MSLWYVPFDVIYLVQNSVSEGARFTALFSKWHLGFFSPEYAPTSRGFDTFFGYYLGAEDYYLHDRKYDGVHGFDLRNNTKKIKKENQYSTYLYGNETMRILQNYATEKSSSPFFIYLAFQAVHGPLEAPQSIIDRFNESITAASRQKKAAMVTVLDDVIGEITEYLKSEESGNLWENTMVIFSTDNGGPVGNSGVEANNFPLRGSKATLWEGGVKGVGFVTGGWLNKDRRGKQMNALMHITDWYPTLCAVAGCVPSNSSILDGYDQLDNLQNGEQNFYQPVCVLFIFVN